MTTRGNSRFLQSNLSSNDLASETTLKNVENTLKGPLDVNVLGGVAHDMTLVDVDFVTTQTEQLGVSLNQLSSTAIVKGNGADPANCQRVCIATNQDEIPCSVYNWGSTPVASGQGTGNGLRVIIDSNQPAININKHFVSGNAIQIGNGTNGNCERVCIASDNSPISTTTDITKINGNTIQTGTSTSNTGCQTVQIVSDQPVLDVEIQNTNSLGCEINDVYIGQYDKMQTDKLGTYADTWELIQSSHFCPFLEDRFYETGTNNEASGDNSYYAETNSTDFAIIRTVQRFKFKPMSTVEVTFSCKLTHYQSGTSALDYQRIGLFSSDISAAGNYPKTSICIESNRSYTPVDRWFAHLFKNLNSGASDQNFISVPSSTAIDTFKFVIYNYPNPIVLFYQLQPDLTNTWHYASALRINDQMYANEYYFGNIFSSSSANVATSTLYGFEIKESVPSFRLYDELPIYRSYNYGNPPITLPAINTLYAISGIQLNDTNSTQTTVWIKNVVLNIESGGEEVYVCFYKNPTLSGAHSFAVTHGRVKFTTLVNSITLTSGLASFTHCGNSVSGSGRRVFTVEPPERTLGLFNEDDEIYLICESLAGINADVHVSWNYHY